MANCQITAEPLQLKYSFPFALFLNCTHSSQNRPQLEGKLFVKFEMPLDRK